MTLLLLAQLLEILCDSYTSVWDTDWNGHDADLMNGLASVVDWRLLSGRCFSPIYDVCCWHLYIGLFNLSLDNTTSFMQDKITNFLVV